MTNKTRIILSILMTGLLVSVIILSVQHQLFRGEVKLRIEQLDRRVYELQNNPANRLFKK